MILTTVSIIVDLLMFNYAQHNHNCFCFYCQKVKTRVIKKDVNREWNEDLTLSVIDPNHPVSLVSK